MGGDGLAVGTLTQVLRTLLLRTSHNADAVLKMFVRNFASEYDDVRFHVLKAVLGFLGEHSSVLRGAFWPIVEEVLEWLLKIARFKTRDVRNLGWDALVAYVGSVAEFLLEDEDGGGSGDEKKREVCLE